MLIYAWGTIGSTATPTLQIRAKFGAVTFCSTNAVALSAITGTNLWQASIYLTVRTVGGAGTLFSQGLFNYFTGASTQISVQMLNTTTSAIDTTIANTLDVSAQWGTTDPLNTISCTNLSALLLG
jgi:hypothetical protein